MQKNDVVGVVYVYVLMGMKVWSLTMMTMRKLSLVLRAKLVSSVTDAEEEACCAILELEALDMTIMEHDWSNWMWMLT